MKRARQYIGILAAVAAYYSVHEGAHLICAVLLGTFKKIRLMGIGMQIDVYAERMTNGQMTLFCPEWIARSVFAGVLIVNCWIFWKRIFPVYKESFSNEEPS